MMIEQNTNYAYKLKYMDNPTFDKVRDLSTKFYRELPQALQNELFEALNRGIDILDSEPQMTAYLFAFGKMHQAKLDYAFGKLPEEFLEQPEINIIDYGCGQTIGTMCFADFLMKNGHSQRVKSITLIEPSEICLKRAALHASLFFPNAYIRTINKSFDELDNEDILYEGETPALHILSNVLDVLDFDLDDFAGIIGDCIYGYNQFVCIGPYFNYSDKDERMEEFCSLLKGDKYYSEFFDRFEFDKDKAWTAQILCFSVKEIVGNTNLSSKVTKEDIDNGIEDKYGVIYSKDRKRLLKCKNHELDTYTIKKGTKVICDNAFDDIDNPCSSLQKIIIPNSVLIIGNRAFYLCGSLRQITVSNSVKIIGDAAFCYCESLQQFIIPDSVTFIGNEAFWGCKSLQQITIPNSIEHLGYNPFCECDKLIIESKSSNYVVTNKLLIDNQNNTIVSYLGKDQIITIPNSVKNIGKCAFYHTKSLLQISIPESVISIGESAFSLCESLQQITIPNSVKSIGNGAFGGCKSLQHITIPNYVTSIGDRMFWSCESLRQITIPNSVTSIGIGAFWACKSLQYIAIPNSVKNIGGGIFLGCEALQKIIIPKGSLERFKKMLKFELFGRLNIFNILVEE